MKKILISFSVLSVCLLNAQLYTPGAIQTSTNGNVGINTAYPAGTLDINANGNIPIIRGNGGYIPTGLRFIDDSYTQAGKVKEWAIWKGKEWANGLGFMRYDAVNPCGTGICDVPLFLNDNGKVGIGIVSPESKLHVYQNPSSQIIDAMTIDVEAFSSTTQAANSNFFKVRNISSGYIPFIIKGNGNIGMGASVPGAKLHIGDDTGAGVLIDSRYTSVAPKIGAQIFWSESTSTRTAGDLVIAPRTDIGSSVAFYTNDGTQIDERMVIKPNGFVGIGSKNPDAHLAVKGLIHAQEVKVDLNVPADYVFQKYYSGASALKPEYTMPTLDDVEKFTKDNNHLPNVPSAKEIQEKGLNVGEMSNLLLQKIEELTLYTIEQNKALKDQNKAIQDQNEIIKEQQKRIEKLEAGNKK